MSNQSSSSLGILGLIVIAVIIYFVLKFTWWILLAIGLLVLLFVVLLILSSKKSKSSASSLEEQVRDALSSIRKQKFKSEAKINRLKEWANDAIYTTYGELFGNKYYKSELLDNFEKIKNEFSDKIPYAQAEKTEQIVRGYLNHIETEKSKIEALEILQKEHEELKQKLKLAQSQKRKSDRLNKHIDRLKSTSDDLSAEETIIKADFTLDDLKKEVELNQEYIKQLEELTMKYGDDITAPQVSEYKQQLMDLKSKI